MYLLSDAQIDYILNDIRARGVEMEDLQQNILDHVCCIIEQNLEANGDFESFYQTTIATFYKDALWEIEEETLTLLIFKNLYTMKKIMFISGAASTILLASGLLFKFMHWPAASVQIILGIVSVSFVFLPLMFTLKIKESQSKKDMLIAGLGTLVCILLSLHVLFKVLHWPFAGLLGQLFFGVLLLVFLPLYFFTGIRHPETKVNTIVSSVLMVLGCSLILILMRSPKAAAEYKQKLTASYLRSEKILANETRLFSATAADVLRGNQAAKEIYELCDQLRSGIIEFELGTNKIPEDYTSKELFLNETSMSDILELDKDISINFEKLRDKLNVYFSGQTTKSDLVEPLNLENVLADLKEDKSVGALQSLIQIQLYMLQNQRNVVASLAK